jgi:hypothetical protein
MMDKYFRVDKSRNCLVFIGATLEAFIPERYRKAGLLTTDTVVSAIGIFDMVINDKTDVGLMLPAMLTMEPSSIESFSDGSDEYTKLTFVKGDVFCYTEIVESAELAYEPFNEIFFLGKVPEFLGYDLRPLLFDELESVCGMNFDTDHAMYEIMNAYLTRSAKDPLKQKRHAPASEGEQFVPLRNVSVLAQTTTSKLLGSYFDDTLNAAIVNHSDFTTEFEQTLIK